MSLILDALNRSRQDSEPMPGLASVHSAETPPQGSHWLQWLLVSALGLAVLAIGWLLLERAPQPVAVPAEVADQVAEPVARPVLERPPPVRNKPVAPQATPVVAAGHRRSHKRPLRNRRQALGGSPPAAPGRLSPLRRKSMPVWRRLYQQPVQAAPPPAQAEPVAQQRRTERPANTSRVEETVDIEQLVAQAQAELKDASLSDHAVPLLASLSQQTKDGIPDTDLRTARLFG